MNNNICKICGSKTNKILTKNILLKYNISYFECSNCDFIQTEDPYWLDESYSSAITDLDVGLVSRNIVLSEIVETIIINNFNYSGRFLDYGGGYGLFVRIMRDKGFDYYREDKYCENIFAKHYDLEYLGSDNSFELISAFEVFEHLVNPIKEIDNFFSYSDSIIFTTELKPEQPIKIDPDWWYFTPETGQHISFYSKKTLLYISERFGCYLYSNNYNLHILTKNKFVKDPFLETEASQITQIKLKSLTHLDFEFAKKHTSEFYKIKNELKNFNDNIIEFYEHKISALLTQLTISQANLESVKNDLSILHQSDEWKIGLLINKLIGKFIPINSLSRRILVKAWRIVKLFFQLLSNIIQIIKKHIIILEIYFCKFPKNSRKIKY